jgi:hypothetical protein
MSAADPRGAETMHVVKTILVDIKLGCFNDDYQASDEEAMGLLLSAYFDWGGFEILKAAEHGLTDANFHSLCGKISRLREQSERAAERQLAARGMR